MLVKRLKRGPMKGKGMLLSHSNSVAGIVAKNSAGLVARAILPPRRKPRAASSEFSLELASWRLLR